MGKANGRNGTLPIGSERIMQLVEQSQPSQTRPKLPAEYEDLLQPIHAMSAACYASMEDLSDRIDRLAHKITDADGVVLEDMDDEDSIVNHIEDVTIEIRDSRTRLEAATTQTIKPLVDGTEESSAAAPLPGQALPQ
jgi:hypothetical protein